MVVDKPSTFCLQSDIRHAHDSPAHYNCKLPGKVTQLDCTSAMYLPRASLVYHTRILNSSESLDSTLLCVVSDFEWSQKPGWETTSERAIHILVSCQYPNTIIPILVATKEPRAWVFSPVYVINIRFLECKSQDFKFCQVFNR